MIRPLAALLLAAAAAGYVPGAAAAPAPSAGASGKVQDLTAIPPVPKTYHPKKTPWGEPDFHGGWPIDHLNFTPMQRPPEQGNRVFLTDEEYAARVKQLSARQAAYGEEEKSGKLGMGHWVEAGTPNRRTSFVIDPGNGRIPEKTEYGKRLSALGRSSYKPGQSWDWVTDFDSWDRCITRGLPASMFPFNYNNGIRIWQSPGVVAIQLEMVHETRIVRTDGRPGIPAKVLSYMGESRGRWEGDNTLVIETTNLHPGPSPVNVGTWGSLPNNDTPISEQARLVERITMTGPDTAVYEMTYSDPVIFTAPFTARLDWRRNDGYGMFEYACHEGNEQVRNFITSSRAQRAAQAKAQQQ